MSDGVSHEPLKVKIAGMDCGSCAITIENSMRQLPGVESASVSFATESMEIDGEVSLADIESRLIELGYRVAAEEPKAQLQIIERRGLSSFLEFLWQQPPLRRALLVAVAVIGGLVFLPDMAPVAGIEPLTWLLGAAVVIAGTPVFLKGLRALIFARRVTIDLLMAVACIGAVGIGETGEAVTVILLFTLGEALEAFSAERARDSLRSLMALQPQEATVLRVHAENHGHDDAHQGDHEHQVVLPVEQIRVGDRVLVRPAQRIPVDGEILNGTSSINQAPVTGESVPVRKTVGDEVMAGTVNGEAALEVRVTRESSEGTIARIAKLVEQAQAQKSPQERFIDRFARWYTPAVVLLAALVVAIPVAAFGAPLLDAADGTRGWLYRGLTLLIIACPCALVISIPVTVVSGLTRLANLGVLVKGGAQLDRLADVRVVAFDKTGTLTHGRPQVTGIRANECAHPADQNDECNSCDDVVAAAAAVERASEHPVAHAIVKAAGERQVAHRFETAEQVAAHPGRGVSGQLSNGVKVAVGSSELFADDMRGWEEISPHAQAGRDSGETVMYVARDDRVVGYIGVQDEIREATRDALEQLDALTPSVDTVMLTGDNRQAAERVAGTIGGIDEVRAELLPDEKLQAIETLREARGATAMVGDGINDAPALARADIGIAVGGGTAQAMETADVVLMQDDLSQVPLALRVARKSRHLIKQNIALSLGLKLAFLALAVPGIATLWMAVVADVGATLLVTLNGMRMLRQS
ncbi:MAG: cation-translocating P-type ATPase [Gammaproteobacteria bacterium]|nr:cation-translocating P-type ATPase [Gammaproteobacteria bacterium]